jgi:cation:H+ antiporter
MELLNFVLFLGSLLFFMRAAHYAIEYASQLACVLHFSDFVVSFFVVSVVSTLPEASISLIAALEGSPAFGLGTLLGSNVADLTLVMGLVAVYSAKGVHVDKGVVQKGSLYMLLLLLPFLLGFDGVFSRVDGLILVFAGFLFFFNLSLEDRTLAGSLRCVKDRMFAKDLLLLLASMAALLVGAHFTVVFGTAMALDLGIPPILIGLTLVSVGTCLPELVFSLTSVHSKHDGLALGDVLGTVVIDATIILGAVALLTPYSFDPLYVYVTGLAMFFAGVLAISSMRSGWILSRKEGLFLLACYVVFLIVELSVRLLGV